MDFGRRKQQTHDDLIGSKNEGLNEQTRSYMFLPHTHKDDSYVK